MKILHITKALDVGGAQRLISDLLPLMKQGHEVGLLLFMEDDTPFIRKVREAGIDVIFMKVSLRNPVSVWRLHKVVRQYDVVHVHLFPELYLGALAAMGTKVNLVFTEHSTSNRRRGKGYLRPLEKWVYHRYRKIISISRQTQDALMGWVQAKADDKRFVVIENGIDVAAFRRVEKKRLQDGRCNIVMVSRFVEAKDQATVIRSMQHLDGSYHLNFVGDGSTMPTCQQMAADMGLSERVSFWGSRADIPNVLSTMDIGVQSSHWEGFGLTAVELMAAGLPVVATDVPGLRQVVEGAGLLFAVGDDKQLAENVKALATDTHYYDQVSASCVERASQYDISVTAKRYLDVYN